MESRAAPNDALSRRLALAIALIGLAISAYVEFGLTKATAQDRFGWFVYEAGAWLALLFIGPFLPIGRAVLVGAVIALGLEVFAYWRAFGGPPGTGDASIYLWKPLAQLALIAAAWFAGYLTYLRAQRERAHG